jgi:endo-1,4-beta-xylanase
MDEVYIMKNAKFFLLAALPMLVTSLLMGCHSTNRNKGNSESDVPEKPVPLEIGDTVKEWSSKYDLETTPLDVKETNEGTVNIVNDFGNHDQCSLECNITGEYISSEVIETPYFTDDDAKNGDIISLYIYLPSDHNIKSLKFQALGSGNFVVSQWGGSSGETISADEISVDENKEEKWIRTELSFDTLETLGALRLNITRNEVSKPAHFFVDDINITLGEETVKTGYEANNESLCEAFEDYFTIGTCMSAGYTRNTKIRQIIEDNFNSVTAENEAKPDSTLDQAACQKLAETDETAVAINIKGFEKIYDWCEAHHIKVRHHTMVWHQQTPAWFFNKGYQSNGQQVSRDVMIGRLNNFIRETIETLDDRWPGLVYAIDIVNEAIEEVGQMRRGNWQNTIGNDYIYQAFLAADKYKMDYQEVYYNDYAFDQIEWGGIERCQWAVDELLKQAIDEELIDGIGIQAHIEKPEYADAVIEDAKIICAAGIKCQITELDINISGNNESAFAQQKDLYKKIVKSVLEGNDNGTMDVNAIIVWGITDNTSWHSSNYPLMFDNNYAKKPAYYGFMEALDEFIELNNY